MVGIRFASAMKVNYSENDIRAAVSSIARIIIFQNGRDSQFHWKYIISMGIIALSKLPRANR